MPQLGAEFFYRSVAFLGVFLVLLGCCMLGCFALVESGKVGPWTLYDYV